MQEKGSLPSLLSSICFLHLGTHLININMSCSLLESFIFADARVPSCSLFAEYGEMEIVAKANLMAAVLRRQLPKRGYKGSFVRKENHQRV